MFDEPKPCPFCGAEAYLFVDHGVRVMCPKCGASSQCLVDGMNARDPTGNATKSVIESWNKRVLDKNVPQHFKGESMRCPICDTPQDKLIKNLANPVAHEVVYCWNCGQAIEVKENNNGEVEDHT